MGTEDWAGTYLDGSRIRWAALASVMFGAPVYAWTLGLLGFIADLRRGFTRALGGVSTFLSGLIDMLFDSGQSAIAQSWLSYWEAARATFGPLAWHATLIAVILFMYLLLLGVRRVAG